jgi:hypothetical protein
MIDAFATVKDAIDPATGQYKNRQVDIDKFNSFTSELRLSHYYQLGAMSSVLVGGVQVMSNDLNRRQLGKGTAGSDYDLTLVVPNDWGRDMHFRTKNVAVFVENLLYITPKLSVSPGFRLESGQTDFSGYIRYLKPEVVPNSIPHRFPLFGISAQYQMDTENRLYGGFSQAYRPVILKDIIPASVLERADKNLKDADGYNAEIGLSGRKGRWHYDLSTFLLQYNNRLGSLILNDPDGTSYIFRTNIGDSRTKGLEMYVEYEFIRSNKTRLSAFTSTAYMDARYVNGKVSNGKENQSIKGNKVESVPEWTSRNGIEFNHRWLSGQFSHASANGIVRAQQPIRTGRVGTFKTEPFGGIGLFAHVINHAAKLRTVLQRTRSAHNFNAFKRLRGRIIVAGRIAIHIGITNHAVVAKVEFPTSVGIKSACRDVNLIARTIHIIDKNTRNFGKNLTWSTLGNVGIDTAQLYNFILFPGRQIRTIDIRKAFNLDAFTSPDNLNFVKMTGRIRVYFLGKCLLDNA